MTSTEELIGASPMTNKQDELLPEDVIEDAEAAAKYADPDNFVPIDSDPETYKVVTKFLSKFLELRNKRNTSPTPQADDKHQLGYSKDEVKRLEEDARRYRLLRQYPTRVYRLARFALDNEQLDKLLDATSHKEEAEIPDNELPGMWERADFTGGKEEVRGPDWNPKKETP